MMSVSKENDNLINQGASTSGDEESCHMFVSSLRYPVSEYGSNDKISDVENCEFTTNSVNSHKTKTTPCPSQTFNSDTVDEGISCADSSESQPNTDNHFQLSDHYVCTSERLRLCGLSNPISDYSPMKPSHQVPVSVNTQSSSKTNKITNSTDELINLEISDPVASSHRELYNKNDGFAKEASKNIQKSFDSDIIFSENERNKTDKQSSIQDEPFPTSEINKQENKIIDRLNLNTPLVPVLGSNAGDLLTESKDALHEKVELLLDGAQQLNDQLSLKTNNNDSNVPKTFNEVCLSSGYNQSRSPDSMTSVKMGDSKVSDSVSQYSMQSESTTYCDLPSQYHVPNLIELAPVKELSFSSKANMPNSSSSELTFENFETNHDHNGNTGSVKSDCENQNKSNAPPSVVGYLQPVSNASFDADHQFFHSNSKLDTSDKSAVAALDADITRLLNKYEHHIRENSQSKELGDSSLINQALFNRSFDSKNKKSENMSNKLHESLPFMESNTKIKAVEDLSLKKDLDISVDTSSATSNVGKPSRSSSLTSSLNYAELEKDLNNIKSGIKVLQNMDYTNKSGTFYQDKPLANIQDTNKSLIKNSSKYSSDGSYLSDMLSGSPGGKSYNSRISDHDSAANSTENQSSESIKANSVLFSSTSSLPLGASADNNGMITTNRELKGIEHHFDNQQTPSSFSSARQTQMNLPDPLHNVTQIDDKQIALNDSVTRSNMVDQPLYTPVVKRPLSAFNDMHEFLNRQLERATQATFDKSMELRSPVRPRQNSEGITTVNIQRPRSTNDLPNVKEKEQEYLARTDSLSLSSELVPELSVRQLKYQNSEGFKVFSAQNEMKYFKPQSRSTLIKDDLCPTTNKNDDNYTVISESTIESTHLGSDDARAPVFSKQVLGSRPDPIAESTGIYSQKESKSPSAQLNTIMEQSVNEPTLAGSKPITQHLKPNYNTGVEKSSDWLKDFSTPLKSNTHRLDENHLKTNQASHTPELYKVSSPYSQSQDSDSLHTTGSKKTYPKTPHVNKHVQNQLSAGQSAAESNHKPTETLSSAQHRPEPLNDLTVSDSQNYDKSPIGQLDSILEQSFEKPTFSRDKLIEQDSNPDQSSVPQKSSEWLKDFSTPLKSNKPRLDDNHVKTDSYKSELNEDAADNSQSQKSSNDPTLQLDSSDNKNLVKHNRQQLPQPHSPVNHLNSANHKRSEEQSSTLSTSHYDSSPLINPEADQNASQPSFYSLIEDQSYEIQHHQSKDTKNQAEISESYSPNLEKDSGTSFSNAENFNHIGENTYSNENLDKENWFPDTSERAEMTLKQKDIGFSKQNVKSDEDIERKKLLKNLYRMEVLSNIHRGNIDNFSVTDKAKDYLQSIDQNKDVKKSQMLSSDFKQAMKGQKVIKNSNDMAKQFNYDSNNTKKQPDMSAADSKAMKIANKKHLDSSTEQLKKQSISNLEQLTLHSIPEDSTMNSLETSANQISSFEKSSTSVSPDLRDKRLLKLERCIKQQKEKVKKRHLRQLKHKEKIAKLERILAEKALMMQDQSCSDSTATAVSLDTSQWTDSSSNSSSFNDSDSLLKIPASDSFRHQFHSSLLKVPNPKSNRTAHKNTRELGNSNHSTTEKQHEKNPKSNHNTKKSNVNPKIFYMEIDKPKKSSQNFGRQMRNLHRSRDSVKQNLKSFSVLEGCRSPIKIKNEAVSQKDRSLNETNNLSSNSTVTMKDFGSTFPSPITRKIGDHVLLMRSEAVQTNFDVQTTENIAKPENEEIYREKRTQPIAKASQTGLSWFIPSSELKTWKKPLHEMQNEQISVTQNILKDLDNESYLDEKLDCENDYVSLQHAFLIAKKEFISRSRCRQRHIMIRAEKRHLEEIIKQEHEKLGNINQYRPSSKKDSNFKVTNIARKSSMKEMRKVAKEKYQNLPEVLKHKRNLKIQEQYKTNRLLAQLYKRRIQNAVLGKVH